MFKWFKKIKETDKLKFLTVKLYHVTDPNMFMENNTKIMESAELDDLREKIDKGKTNIRIISVEPLEQQSSGRRHLK